MSYELPDRAFVVERLPLVSHPDIYARICLYSRSKPAPCAYFCSDESALVSIVEELQSMGAVEVERPLRYLGYGVPPEQVGSYLELERMNRINKSITEGALNMAEANKLMTPGPHPLKRCPFCGSEALYFQADYTQSVAVKCDGCDALGPLQNSKEDAVAWWNERGGCYESSTAS